MTNYAAIVALFASTGLLVRGGTDGGSGSVILLGNAGPGMWPRFAADRRDEPHPLDAWAKRVVEPIAGQLGAHAVYPSDRPYQPFIAWAKAAEPVYNSPLGLTIHPDYGLWHAFRAALLFDGAIAGIPLRAARPSPCDTCAGKPCLKACPVAAFTVAGYDVDACAAHLLSDAEPHCATLGCRARDACPAGAGWRYPEPQIQFHMAAFAKARRS